MTNEKLYEAIGDISDKKIKEAKQARKAKQSIRLKWGAMAACLCLVAAICTMLAPFNNTMAVAVYAYGNNEQITSAGAVISTGTINNNGVMTGQPLMFYLSGEDIETVRFSCKNQQINFMDWTQKRDEYGNAQNFTVIYGEDESEYYYLTINWVPNTIIRELTDNAETTIATLPAELREDIIVMEITFANGKTATKAITVSLLEDGTFFASYNDYEITAEDDFVERIDSESIPRDVLYAQGANAGRSEDSSVKDVLSAEENGKDADPYKPMTVDSSGSITFTGTIVDHTIESLAYIILVDVDENSGLPYDKVLFELTDDQKMWESKIGARVQIVCSDSFQESRPPIGELISIEEVGGTVTGNSLDTAKMTAQDYYTDTVFEVVSMELKSQTAEEISFTVCVSKGGVVQEPNRTIFLQLVNGSWEVVNEGY